MNDDVEDAGTSSRGPTLFKKKNKARFGPAGMALSQSSQVQTSKEIETNEEAAEDGIAVRRTAGIGPRSKSIKDSKAKKMKPPIASALSFGEEAIEPAFQLKKSALAQVARSSKEALNAVLPDSLDQASIAESSNGYSASALAALKASTPARRKAEEEVIKQGIAHQEMIDPSEQFDEQGGSLARLRFGADLVQAGIPSEALVSAAKERRRRAAVGVADNVHEDDYISLQDTNKGQGPHPESRLQREEDELGSGEEDFAQFTGATDRVALGHDAIKQAKKREREERREAMDLDEDDDSGQEWERAQMERIDIVASRKQRDAREKSPFRPAPIPMTAPLPTLSSTSARLATRVAALDSSIQAHGQVINDAVRQLDHMEGDEKKNKANIEVMGTKEAWFRELEEFIITLSTFLEEKMPRLEEIESDWKDLLVERSRMVESAMMTAMTDEACLFYGVPSQDLLPTATSNENGTLEGKVNVDPSIDGNALSQIREIRRGAALSSNLADLNPGDAAAFDIAQKDIQRRLRQLLVDVKAPEFIDPAARLDTKLHPSSLVERFNQWKKLYPEEYASAWGGLTLAGIWDFWIRKDLCGWDFVKRGNQGLDDFHWHQELTQYSAAVEDDSAPIGGDEEVILHVICNTVIPRFLEASQAGAFNPWNAEDCRSMTELLEQISYVLERDNVRILSLVSSFLHTFGKHIDALVDSLSKPPISSPPPFDPRSPIALLSFLSTTKTLLFNLLLLNRHVSASEKSFYLDLVDRLVGRLIWNLLIQAKDYGGKQIAQEILQQCAKGNVLKEDVRARLAAMARN